MLGFVIGDGDMVTGFRLVGVEGAEVNSPVEARDAFEKALARKDLAIIVISEEFSAKPQLQEAIERARREQTSPLIVEMPGSKGKQSDIHVSDLVSKTFGVRM